MEVKFDIPDDKTKDFSNNAKNKVIDYAQKCTFEVINEAELIELSTHDDDSPTEITANHVAQAANSLRSIRTIKKNKRGKTIFKIISEILVLVSGIMFLPEQFITADKSLNIAYLITYILVLAVAIITTIISHFWGDE